MSGDVPSTRNNSTDYGPVLNRELRDALRKIDQMHQDWFGPDDDDGMRDILVETQKRSFANEAEIRTAKTFVRWVLALVSLIPVGLGFLAWYVGQQV